MERITQAEIARRLGVSQAAVSTVLRSPEGGRISDVTRNRILSYLEDVNYEAPRRRRPELPPLGVLWGDAGNPALLLALRQATSSSGRRLVVESGEGEDDLSLDIGIGMGGMIIATDVDDTFLSSLANGLPTVLVNKALGLSVCDEVLADDRLGVRLGFEHLYELGHRRIAFVGYDRTADNLAGTVHYFHERAHSFREVAMDYEIFGNGVLFRPVLRADVMRDNNPRTVFKDTLEYLLSLPEPPTAIMAYNDAQARGIFRDAELMGVKVPGDISLVGYDNAPVELPGDAVLTSVDANFKAQADAAVSLLLNSSGLVAEREPVRVLCRPKLVVGETTAPPPEKLMAVQKR